MFLKNRNFISKINRSKSTDYAALSKMYFRKEENISLTVSWVILHAFLSSADFS